MGPCMANIEPTIASLQSIVNRGKPAVSKGGCGTIEDGVDAALLDDEMDELMSGITTPSEITPQKAQKTWSQLRDSIDKILKAEKSKLTLTLSQVSNYLARSATHD